MSPVLWIVFSITVKLLTCDEDVCLNMADLSDIELYVETDGDKYIEACKQWAYPSHGSDRMHPSIILYPRSDAEIFTALTFSDVCSYNVVIRSGGNQYDALSSCNSNIHKCMQIDMKYYNKMNICTDNKTLRVEPAVKLGAFNAYLDKYNYFLPGGSHTNIAIGGHIVTGGDGHLSKTHGLLADYVISFDIILSNATKLTNITVDSDLYWAVLGGGPGSFGIVTKYELDLHKTHNNDYVDSVAFIYIFKFSKELMFAFGDLYIKMHENEQLKYIHNDNVASFFLYFMYDFQLNQYVIKISWIWTGGHNANEEDKYFLSSLFLTAAKQVSIEPQIKKEIHNGISSLLMQLSQDYGLMAPLPYMQTSYLTLKNFDDEFVDLLVDRTELVMQKYGLYLESGMALMFLFESFGGASGAIYKNDPLMRKTSYSYRKQLIGLPITMFYDVNVEKESKRMSRKWIDDTMEILMLTSPYHYGAHDFRHISKTFGDVDIDKVSQYYYQNKTAYLRLKEIKLKYDPIDLFHTTFTVPLPNQYDHDNEKKDL